MKNLICLFVIVLFTGFISVSAQTQDRRMILDDYDCDEPAVETQDEDSRCLIELVEVQIDGRKIVSGEPFVADENWMKNLKVKIRNVSGKPFVAVSVGFGLIEGLYEELAPGASWGWGFGLTRHKLTKLNAKKRKNPRRVVLKPNEEMELTFADYKSPVKKDPLMKVVGKMNQIVLLTSIVEYEDGSQENSRFFTNKK